MLFIARTCSVTVKLLSQRQQTPDCSTHFSYCTLKMFRLIVCRLQWLQCNRCGTWLPSLRLCVVRGMSHDGVTCGRLRASSEVRSWTTWVGWWPGSLISTEARNSHSSTSGESAQRKVPSAALRDNVERRHDVIRHRCRLGVECRPSSRSRLPVGRPSVGWAPEVCGISNIVPLPCCNFRR